MKIKIVKQKEVVELFNNSSILKQWEILIDQTPHVTAQQEIGFVKIWYQEYQQFEPLIVLGYVNSQLEGILPLAYNPKTRLLTHAGAWQAEYHGWLAKDSFAEEFLVKSIIKLKSEYDVSQLKWGWLPPRSNHNWLNSNLLKKANIYTTISSQISPLLDVTDEEFITKLKKNKSIRIKLNRYAKAGDFKIERITSLDKAKSIFDELAQQCDFRQLAANKSIPFTSDPNKKSFHLNRLEFPERCHFSVLWSNNKPIAFHFGECDDTTVFLGVTGFDPRESRNSPGRILIIKLSELLFEEGYKYLDLTPGGDEYKESFGNKTQKLSQPQFYFSQIEYLKASLKKKSKNLAKKIYYTFNNPKSSKVNRKKRQTESIIDPTLYALKKNLQFDRSETYSVAVNEYADLLLSDESLENRSKSTSQALYSFSNEETLISYVVNGKLRAYFWLTKIGKLPRALSKFKLAESDINSRILYNIYVKDENSDDFETILKGFFTTIQDESIFIWKEDQSTEIHEGSEILNSNLAEKINVEKK